MSTDQSGHATNVAMEHCEQRPSPYPPVVELRMPNRSIFAISGNEPKRYLDAARGEFHDQWRAFSLARMTRKEAA